MTKINLCLSFALATLLFACVNKGEQALQTESSFEAFLQGKRLEYLVTAEVATTRGLGVAINFIDTAFCLLTYYNGLEEPERLQPYKLIARWDLTDGPDGIRIAVRSQLFNIDLNILSYDSRGCQLETAVMGTTQIVAGLFHSIQMPEERFAAREKRLQGEWVGDAIDSQETIDVALTATEARIQKGASAQRSTPWHLSYDGRYIILPEREELIMISADPMGLPIDEMSHQMFLTFMGTQVAVYPQYKVERVPKPGRI